MSRTIVIHPEILFQVEVRFKRKINPTKVWLRETVPVHVVLHDAEEVPVVATLTDTVGERRYPLFKKDGGFFVPIKGSHVVSDGIEASLSEHFTSKHEWHWREARNDLSEHGIVSEIHDETDREKAVLSLKEHVGSFLFVSNEEGGYDIAEGTTEPVLTIKSTHYAGKFHAWIGVEFLEKQAGHVSGRWRLDAEAEARASRRILDADSPSGLVRILRPDLLEYDHHRHIAMEAMSSTIRAAREWLGRNLDTATTGQFAAWRHAAVAWADLNDGTSPDSANVGAVRNLATVLDRTNGSELLRELDKKLAPTRHAVPKAANPSAADEAGPDVADEDERSLALGL